MKKELLIAVVGAIAGGVITHLSAVMSEAQAAETEGARREGQMEAGFSSLEDKMDAALKRLGSLESRFLVAEREILQVQALEHRIQGIDKSLDRLTLSVDGLTTTVLTMKDSFVDNQQEWASRFLSAWERQTELMVSGFSDQNR